MPAVLLIRGATAYELQIWRLVLTLLRPRFWRSSRFRVLAVWWDGAADDEE